jgi:hypothetical protein
MAILLLFKERRENAPKCIEYTTRGANYPVYFFYGWIGSTFQHKIKSWVPSKEHSTLLLPPVNEKLGKSLIAPTRAIGIVAVHPNTGLVAKKFPAKTSLLEINC